MPILPREQLVSQWRELSSIASHIRDTGTPNHVLVNPIINYPLNHFITYAAYVRAEMTKRGYRTMDRVWANICSVVDNNDYNIVPIEEVFPAWHDDEYLRICYWNLYEKHIRGGISDEVWRPIHEYVLQHFWERIEAI